MTFRVLYLSEGSSDEGLRSHLEGIAAEAGVEINVSAPDLRWLPCPVGRGVPDKLRATRELDDTYDLAVLHRDSDKEDPRTRRDEIADAITAEWPELRHIPVVPVRMLEAWLLLDEQAIRLVSGNPNGRVPLNLPKPSTVERLADPKQQLKETLSTASGCRGRRLADLNKRFPHNRHRLLDLLDRDGPVSEVPSWRAFVVDLVSALQSL